MNTPNTIQQHLNNNTVIASIILGIAFIGGLWAYGQRPTTDEVITITGSAKETVVADLATYTLSLDKTYPVATGLKAMIADFEKKTSILAGAMKNRGVLPENIKIGEISVQKNYESTGYMVNTQNIVAYSLSRTISTETKDIELAKKLAKEMNTAAANNDLALSSSSANYQYMGLEVLRPKLLKLATEDAKVKAEAMASSTGRSIGSLRAGRMGVVQVLAKNSVDVSDYGSYDLSNPEKDVFVTVNVTFELK